MPRPARFSPSDLVERALPVFWKHGYRATSIDDLTRCTQASRHAVYGAFADKRAFLMACLDAYKGNVVSPAFAPLECPGAAMKEIATYFERQIGAAEAAGFPSCGCLLANLMTEAAPHDAEIADVVREHLTRLRSGFANALRGAAGVRSLADADLDEWANLLVTTAQGVWSISRVSESAADVRCSVAALLKLLEGALAK